MNTPTLKELKEFCQLNNIHWHELKTAFSELFHYECTCGEKFLYLYELRNHVIISNPTFSHPEEVLEVIEKRSDRNDFLDIVGYACEVLIKGKRQHKKYIEYEYLKEPYKLFHTALEWSREHPLEEEI
jgi:hypothetical protein